MARIVYKQMPAPRELSQQILATGQKLGCKSPRVGANFWCKCPGVREGMVMDEIDTCIKACFGRDLPKCRFGRKYVRNISDILISWVVTS